MLLNLQEKSSQKLKEKGSKEDEEETPENWKDFLIKNNE